MNIAVIGTGYVGLVLGTCLADSGNSVVCVDKIREKIDILKNGESPIYEPGLIDLLKRNIKEKRLSFTTDIGESVKKAQIVFIAVGTPQDEDGSADLTYVLNAAKEIAVNINEYKLIVTKSTVPVGTQKKIKKLISENTEYDFDVASNPEFLKEGAAINDFMRPDRIVIGVESERAEKLLKDIYSPYVRTENPILVMNPESSEMTKYAANAMLATKISFINEMANLCELYDADIDFVRKGIGFDKRIGFQFLYPGAGFGGSCFPKDIRAVINMGREKSFDMKLVNAVDNVNLAQKMVLFNKAKEYYQNLKGKKFAVWGLSFKPKTDDMREAPSITVINELLNAGAEVTTFDPVATDEGKRIFGDKINYSLDQYDSLKDKDGLFVITEWNEFMKPDFKLMSDLLKEKVIFDGRNIYSKDIAKEFGFVYFSIGRTVVKG